MTSHMAKNKGRRVRRVRLTSLIVVGEGPHDEAFLKHLKDLYDDRNNNQRVKIESADGGSPREILKYVARKMHTSYDSQYVLIDSDVPISHHDQKYAARNNIEIIQSTPICLEGMLLDVLGEPIPHTNQGCKDRLHPLLSGPPTLKSSYSDLFTLEVLDQTHIAQIVLLRDLIRN